MSHILNAARLATWAHRGQKRKYTGRDYIEHPYRVAMRVASLPDSTEEMVAAALLHDTLEDTALMYDKIYDDISPSIAAMVISLTNQSNLHPEWPRWKRKELDRAHLAGASRSVKLIKLCDRIDNLREMDRAPKDFQKVYARETLLLAEVIGDADEGSRRSCATSR